MNLSEALALVAVVLVIFGGIWGIIKTLLARDRKMVEDQQKAMWRRLDEVRDQLQDALIEQAKLKERVDGAPDWETRIQGLETRLEHKFDDLMKQIRDLYAQTLTSFQRR